MEIYRILQCSDGEIVEIALVASKQSAIKYLRICYQNSPAENVFYFSSRVCVEE